MALISNIGKSNVVVYGTQHVFQFSIRFVSTTMTSVFPLNTQQSLVYTNPPTIGTLIVAGATVTLVAADIISPNTVAAKIKSNGVSGYNVSIDTYDPTIVKLQSTTIGPITAPTVALGTATNIIFFDKTHTPGVLCPVNTPCDDICVSGSQTTQLNIVLTSATGTTVQLSTGTKLEQEAGTLTYGSAISFTGGAYQVTTPINYIRVTTAGITAPSQVKLYVTRFT
jgi:hypothetical protein